MRHYNRWKPWHWLLACFSNSRKINYTPPDIVGKVGPHDYVATTRFLYWFRNRFHDFNAYIIGLVDDQFEVIGAGAKGIWSWHFLRREHGWMIFPYIRWRPQHWEFYLGWREDGQFGTKFRHHR